MPTSSSVFQRRHAAVVAAGYVTGAIALPLLPGAVVAAAGSAIVGAALAFLVPTAAAVMCLTAERLLRHRTGELQEASVRAVGDVLLAAVLFMFALHVLVLGSVAGLPLAAVAPHRIVVVLFGLFVLAVGNVLPRVRPNLAFGMRTPALLASGTAWARVHRTAGYGLVCVGGTAVVAGIALSKQQIPLAISTVVLVTAIVTAVAYRRSTHE